MERAEISGLQGCTIEVPVAFRWEKLRRKMVDTQLVARGLRDERVLDAMRRVPRHRFVPLTQRWRAYDDHSLAIGYDQTISQPYIVAMMVEALGLKGFEKVLEIGTGSGYEAAVLAALCRRVDTLEIIPELADQAQALLNELGLANVYVHTADGSQGFPEQAPYDAIVVTAGAPKIPPALLDQLTPEGKLVAPLGSRSCQMLTLIQKRGSGLHQEELGECIFVPLRGSYGWPEE